MASIHDKVRDGLSLAKIYADDGAFRTAAARLRTLADELEAHAAWCDAAPADGGPYLQQFGRAKRPGLAK